jgi:hypothetical protein
MAVKGFNMLLRVVIKLKSGTPIRSDVVMSNKVAQLYYRLIKQPVLVTDRGTVIQMLRNIVDEEAAQVPNDRAFITYGRDNILHQDVYTFAELGLVQVNAATLLAAAEDNYCTNYAAFRNRPSCGILKIPNELLVEKPEYNVWLFVELE